MKYGNILTIALFVIKGCQSGTRNSNV